MKRFMWSVLFAAVCFGCVAMGGVDGGALQMFYPDVKNAVPEFEKFGRIEGRKVQLLDASGKEVGSLMLAPSGKYERTEGFNGYIDTAVIVGADGRIAGVAIGRNSETPRWIQRIRRGGLLKRWNGKTPAEASGMEVDGVTGATYSSNAVKGEVKAILQ